MLLFDCNVAQSVRAMTRSTSSGDAQGGAMVLVVRCAVSNPQRRAQVRVLSLQVFKGKRSVKICKKAV